MLLLMWYTGLVTLQMKVCSEGIILYCCYFLMQCAQEICYQYWPGKSSETEKNGEFNVSMLEMVNRDGFVQRLISITDPKTRHIHLIFMDLVHTLNQKQLAHLLTA